MAYPMKIIEEDKAIEVRSEIICTRLGCETKNDSSVLFDVIQKTNSFLT